MNSKFLEKRSRESRKDTEENKQDCHLGHSHRARIQFWNALISLISTLPHSIILGEKKAASRQRCRRTRATLWKSTFFMLAPTQQTLACLLKGFVALYASSVLAQFQLSWPLYRILEGNTQVEQKNTQRHSKGLFLKGINL